MHRSTVPILVILALAVPARTRAAESLCSQLSNLVSRPTVSTTACTVDVESLMVESGYTNQTSPGPQGSQTVSLPQSTLRTGLARNVEFVLTPPTYEHVSSAPATGGDADGMLGLKYRFVSNARIASAVAASYTLSTGTPALETTGEGTSLAIDTNYTVSPAFGLSSTFAYVSYAAGAAQPGAPRSNAFAPSLGVSLGLPANLSIFAEGYGKTSAGAGAPGAYGVDGGVSYDAGSRLQLDANLFDTIGAAGGAKSHAVGFGAAYLFGPSP